MNKIKKIGIFCNDDLYSKKIFNELHKKIKKYNYCVDNNNFDLGIAIGGDGSFLRMLKETSFNAHIYYLGINTGTLGFAQEIYPDEIDKFLQMLRDDSFKVENISVQETKILTEEGELKLHSVNEIVIRDINLKTTYLDLYVNNELLEKFVGDGILISTSFGSTAYNLGLGGSLVYNDLHTLQITPIAPINNKNYRTLKNSVIIPEERKIVIYPLESNKNFVITADGENYTLSSLISLATYVKKEKIKCIRMSNYDYTKRINEKFIK